MFNSSQCHPFIATARSGKDVLRLQWWTQFVACNNTFGFLVKQPVQQQAPAQVLPWTLWHLWAPCRVSLEPLWASTSTLSPTASVVRIRISTAARGQWRCIGFTEILSHHRHRIKTRLSAHVMLQDINGLTYECSTHWLLSILQVLGAWMEAWEPPWPTGQQPAPWTLWPRPTQGCSSTQPLPCPPSTASLSCSRASLAARRKVSSYSAHTTQPGNTKHLFLPPLFRFTQFVIACH